MPNIQFSVPESVYAEAMMRAKHMKLSTNRLGKAVFLRWLRTVTVMEAMSDSELTEVLKPPPFPEF